MVPKENETNEELLARALLVADESIKARDAKIERLRNMANGYRVMAESNERKATIVRAISASKGSVTVGEFAKVLCQHGSLFHLCFLITK